MLAYTGSPMHPMGWDREEPLVIDLAGMRVSAKSRPVLRDHDAGREVGHTDSIRVVRGQLHASGVVSGDGEDARRVLNSSRKGFPWQASIGVEIGEVESVADGQRVKVNGKEMVGPLAIARASILGEISFVALGADDDTVAVAASKGAGSMTFAQWLKAKNIEESTLTDALRTTLKNAYEAERAAAAEAEDDDEQDGDDVDAEDDDAEGDEDDDDSDGEADASGDEGAEDTRAGRGRSRGVRGSRAGGGGGRGAPGGRGRRLSATTRELRAREVAETARVEKIRAICRRYRMPGVEATAIEEGWSAQKTELTVLRASRAGAPGARGGSGGSGGGEVSSAAIEVAMARSCGVQAATIESRYRAQDLEAADRAGLRRIGLSGLFMEAARLAGNPVGIGGLQDDHIRAALSASYAVSASGMASTISVPTILSNVASLVMLEGYRSVPDIVPSIAFERDVDDFKEVKSVRLVTRSAFDEVGPDGELKHSELGEQAYANRAKTYGTQLTLTRQMIIDDSLNAFMRVPRELGQLAMSRKNEVAITTLLGAPTGPAATDFFRTNINWFTGADTALSIDSITLAKRKFYERIGPNGKPILMKPSIMLVSPKNETLANRIYKSENIAGVELVNTPERNPHAGAFRPEMSAYLAEVAGLPGANDDEWWLIADPLSCAALEAVYLRGQREPMIRSAEAPIGRLGLSFDAVFDFGFALQDDMAIVGMKGKE